ncbi:hypothetical protein ACLOJK_037080 [Asimina triloba]
MPFRWGRFARWMLAGRGFREIWIRIFHGTHRYSASREWMVEPWRSASLEHRAVATTDLCCPVLDLRLPGEDAAGSGLGTLPEEEDGFSRDGRRLLPGGFEADALATTRIGAAVDARWMKMGFFFFWFAADGPISRGAMEMLPIVGRGAVHGDGSGRCRWPDVAMRWPWWMPIFWAACGCRCDRDLGMSSSGLDRSGSWV